MDDDLLQKVEEARATLSDQLPEHSNNFANYRYMQSQTIKQTSVLAYTMHTLNRQVELSKSLEYHIAMQDALDLFAASDGFGTDETKMSTVLISRRPEGLRVTDEIYKEKYGMSLEQQVKGENCTLLGNVTGSISEFGKFLSFRTMSIEKPRLLAVLIRKCVEGVGTSDYNLCEILSTNKNDELRAASLVYNEEYGEDMKTRVKSETDGMGKRDYGKWVATLLEFDRFEASNVPNEEEADDLADRLYRAGAKKMMGCDEDVFLEILCKASEGQCRAIDEAYSRLDRSLSDDIKKKMSGDLEFAVLARLTPKFEFLAGRIYSACKGIGTDEECISRVFGGSTNEECLLIKEAYSKVYGSQDEPFNDLGALIDSEVSGNFKDCVLLIFSDDNTPPKNHWRSAETYPMAAMIDAVEFANNVTTNFSKDYAISEGFKDLTGPLSYYDIDDPFLGIPGCSFDVPPACPPFVSTLDVNYLLNSTPENDDDGDALLNALGDEINNHAFQIMTNGTASTSLMPVYVNKAYSLRAACHHCAQVMADNEAMLEYVCQRDATLIHEATEGWGTDDGELIRIIAQLSKPQLSRVNTIYFQNYGQTLKNLLNSELEGFYGSSKSFKYFMECLISSGAEIDAELLVESMKGWGTDEKLLTEVICTRTNEEMRGAKIKFMESEGKSVEEWVVGDTSSIYQRFLLTCLKCERKEGFTDEADAEVQAEKLWDAGLSAWSVDVLAALSRDEEILLDITANAGREQLLLIDKHMTAKYSKSLFSAIKDAMGGDIETAMLIRSMDKYEYFAKALNDAWEGIGTDEVATSRILGRVSKGEVKMIITAYERKFGKRVKDGIESETSGNYQMALLTYLYTEAIGGDESGGEVQSYSK